MTMKFPERGAARDAVLAELDARRERDADWRRGRLFGYVYNAGDEVTELLTEVYHRVGMTNALNPMAFPSLREYEAEVLGWAADLLGDPEAAGSITTGGTESICMAVKTAREHGRAERGITAPEMVVPATVHPAFHKAAHYFGLRAVTVPVGPDGRVDPDAVRAAVTPNTALIVGSAPNYPYGTIDPIEDLASLAQSRGILCHVDACLGGYFLPFVERLGRALPRWDFRVPGVTSISADLHKYGYAAKGASTVLYRDRALRRYQFFAYADWPGGLYASPSMTGARGGGPIAAAWAVLRFLGVEGFTRLARDAMAATDTLLEGIRAVPGLAVMGEPAMSVFAFRGDGVDAYALGERLEARGWVLDRLQLPPALHMMCSPVHTRVAGEFLADLRELADAVRREGAVAEGTAAMYGALATLSDRDRVHDVILDVLDGLY